MPREPISLKLETLKELAKDKIILIVEDNVEVSKNLARLLAHFFANIQISADAQEALEFYTQLVTFTSPSKILIVSDINLGSTSGIEFIEQVKLIHTDQKAIVISGMDNSAMFMELIKLGVDRFVLKPLVAAELIEAVVATLQKMDYDAELAKNRLLLEESREYSVRLLEDQDQFLKNAIHEIYTPLAVIITNIDLLRFQGISNGSLDAIEAGSRIIQTSYNDMTYLMEHRNIIEERSCIDLIEFMKNRIEYFDCIANANELSISFRLSQPTIPFIYFPLSKLHRIVDNTISNAIKYSYRLSQISIMVGVIHEKIFFEIKNRGDVISDKKKIFERFHRESTHKGGYGLGLNIVAHICEEEDIGIEISSTQARGTKFRYVFNNPDVTRSL